MGRESYGSNKNSHGSNRNSHASNRHSNGSSRHSNNKSSYDATSDNVTSQVYQEEKNIVPPKKINESNIQSILENELYNNVSDDSDTSISYTHGNFNDESFEDVFSNVNGDSKNNKSEIASIASE